MEIRWFKKGKGRGPGKFEKDVRLSVFSEGKCVAVSFFNGAFEKITNGDYLQSGICGSRIYFRSSDKFDGMKANHCAKSSNFRSRDKEFVDFAKKHKAEYELEYDVENNLFYIEDKESNV